MPHGVKIFPNLPTLEYYKLGFGDKLKDSMTIKELKKAILNMPDNCPIGIVTFNKDTFEEDELKFLDLNTQINIQQEGKPDKIYFCNLDDMELRDKYKKHLQDLQVQNLTGKNDKGCPFDEQLKH